MKIKKNKRKAMYNKFKINVIAKTLVGSQSIIETLDIHLFQLP